MLKSKSQVRILNPNLRHLLVQQEWEPPKSPPKEQKRSPEQTLKHLIKNGLTQYCNPFYKRKYFKSKLNASKENLWKSRVSGTSVQRQTHMASSNTQINYLKNRVKTEQLCDYDYESQLKDQKLQFRQFRNISEVSLKNFNRQKDRKTIKLDFYKTVKFESTWKKHSVPK